VGWSLHLIVRADGHIAGAELPAAEVASGPAWLAEQPGVVRSQTLWVLT
jgi:hypothetical protein